MYNNMVFERRQLDRGSPDDGVPREPAAATQKRVSGARATPARRLRHYATPHGTHAGIGHRHYVLEFYLIT